MFHSFRPASLAIVLAFLAGCSPKPKTAGPGPAPDDEAKRIGKTEADFRYHIEKKEDGTFSNDFFRDMDKIATLQGRTRENAFAGTEAAPVDQLLDKELAARLPTDQKLTDAEGAASKGAATDQPPRILVDAVSTPNEVLGRNTWLAWCGGNEGFWDWLASNGYGFTDFLKLIDTRDRATRFQRAGLINEPGMKQGTSPDANGIWLDQTANDPTDQDRAKVLENIYGRSTGVIGLRLFDNPNFAAAKDKWDPQRYYSDPDYYNDPGLVRPYRVGMSCAFCHASFHPLNPPTDLANPRWENLSGSIGAQYLRIRAVVGNLLKPDNLVYHILDSQPPGTVDTSLIATDSINNPNAMNAIFGLKLRVVKSFRNPPELQTNVARTQPALWGNPEQTLADGESSFVWKEGDGHKLEYSTPDADKLPPEFAHAFEALHLLDRVQASNNSKSGPALQARYVPRVLFDGADSIGAWGALSRVYLNIGTYWERWNMLQNPLIGFKDQSPFTIDDCETHSVYWKATQERVAALRDYFLKVSAPMPLLATAGGSARAIRGTPSKEPADALKTAQLRAQHIDINQLARGRQVFAHNCIVCHSSVQPDPDFRQPLYDAWASKNPPEPWDHDPGQWLTNPQYRAWAESAVETPQFWRSNYLSTDYRIPVNYVKTNSGRAVGTNGLRGHMWNDFSSESYKQMPSIGNIPFYNPYKDATGLDDNDKYTPRHKKPEDSPECGGGVGFYRVPTLISIWSTAPLLHNNSLGLFNNDPTVNGRLEAFDDAITKLLFMEKRYESSSYNGATPDRLRRDHGLIWRTPTETYISLPPKYLPGVLTRLPVIGEIEAKLQTAYEHASRVSRLFRWLTHPLWLLSAILIVAAGLVFVFAGRRPDPQLYVVESRRFWARVTGYALIVAALVVGTVLYVVAGDLGTLRIGPIPAGTPINLLANLNPDADPAALRSAVLDAIKVMAEIKAQHLDPEAADRRLRRDVAPALMAVSRCPDFVMDKGHYYPWFNSMTDEDKYALIELLKTF